MLNDAALYYLSANMQLNMNIEYVPRTNHEVVSTVFIFRRVFMQYRNHCPLQANQDVSVSHVLASIVSSFIYLALLRMYRKVSFFMLPVNVEAKLGIF